MDINGECLSFNDILGFIHSWFPVLLFFWLCNYACCLLYHYMGMIYLVFTYFVRNFVSVLLLLLLMLCVNQNILCNISRCIVCFFCLLLTL